jgi:pimeloyl-ACP methyl ester carboxylesterase
MKRWKKILRILFVVLALLACVGPFLVPVPPLEGTFPESVLADPDGKFIGINGVNVHYKEQGSGGTTFILLHGFGASLFSWREVMDDFAVRGRVVAYDRPAFGLTSRPMPENWTANPYSMDANIELLRGLMDVLDIQKAVLVGNSAGGGVAAEFALRYPARVQALILVDPAVGNDGGRLPAWVMPLMATPQMRRLGPLFVRKIADSGNDTIRMAWHDPGKVTDAIIAGYRKPLQVPNWERALYEFTIAAQPSDLSSRLSEISAPILILTGDDDRIIPTKQTVQLAGQMPSAAFVILPDCGHVPQEECPDAFMQAIIQFLEIK